MAAREPYETLAFPMMDSAEAVDAADWLSDNEKEMALGNLNKIARTDGFWLLNNNPELARLMCGFGIQLFSNTGDGPATPGKAGQVLHYEVARLLNSEFLLGTLTVAMAKMGADGGLHPMLMGMITEPDFPGWTEDQRLGIKFANALVTNTMTPELRAEAISLWGPQRVLSYCVMTGWAWIWATLANVLGLRWEHGVNDQLDNISGVDAAAAGAFAAKLNMDMTKYWDEAKLFGDSTWQNPMSNGKPVGSDRSAGDASRKLAGHLDQASQSSSVKGNSMKAAVYERYGDADVIQMAVRPVPEIKDDEVLIKVAATAFNPGDINIRTGMLRTSFKLTFPFVPCLDVAGTVEKVGPSVANLAVGDKVFAYGVLNQPGAAAEYIALKGSIVAKAPKSLPLADAAALPAAICTATPALFDLGQLRAGQRVMIIGASGGVGTVAVQLAKAAGVEVVAVASGKRAELLRSLGADEVLDYETQPMKAGVTAPVDVIVNLTNVDTEKAVELFSLLKPGGAYIAVAAPPPVPAAQKAGVRAAFTRSRPDAEWLARAAELVDAGKLKPVITERASLEQLAEVQSKVGTTSGKVLIVID